MNQCTAVTLLPPPDHVVRLAAPGPPPQAGYVLCELGDDDHHHDGDHAALLWDDDAGGEAVWARWNENRATLTALPWCTATDARSEDACGLFAGHPSAHDWDVTDPTIEAVEAVLAGEYPHLFPEYTEGEG